MSIDAFHACNRFGLGPRGDELRTIASDPRGWLRDQLKNPQTPVLVTTRLAGHTLVKQKSDMGQQQRGLRDNAGNVVPLRKIYMAETANRMAAHTQTPQGFVERQVMFWSNHFTVSIQKNILTGIVNRYEAEAIRPHINGHFKDMLLAVAHHPAMLMYLDNAQSIGPNSRAGQRRSKGLNENYARETLELHTLGVNGGYTQDDVIALARILTGWSLAGEQSEPLLEFQFRPNVHESGSKTLLGKTFTENGEGEAVAALTMLAQHPATARHIATKLARHYIADTPPEDAIAALEKTYIATDGHIPSIMETLVGLDAAWATPLAKVKTHYEYAVSAFRALGIVPEDEQAVKALAALNYRAFDAPSPQGYPDTAADIISPDAILKRIDWAHALSTRVPASVVPLDLVSKILGQAATDRTKLTIQQAASGQDGIAFLLISPEFQRR